MVEADDARPGGEYVEHEPGDVLLGRPNAKALHLERIGNGTGCQADASDWLCVVVGEEQCPRRGIQDCQVLTLSPQ